jgi:hypothetical protein
VLSLIVIAGGLDHTVPSYCPNTGVFYRRFMVRGTGAEPPLRKLICKEEIRAMVIGGKSRNRLSSHFSYSVLQMVSLVHE